MDSGLQEHRVTSTALNGFCFDCRHELVDSSSMVCPECGRWFDPDDAATSYRRRPGYIFNVVLATPGLAWFLVTSLVCLLYLASESAPGGYFMLGILVFLCFFAIALVFFGELVMHFIALWFCGRRALFERQNPVDAKPRFRRRELMWFMPPLLVLSSMFLVRIDAPFRLAFLLSEDALESYVLSPPLNRSSLPGWIGLFAVESIHGNVITLKSGGFLEVSYLIYVDDVSEASYLTELFGKKIGATTWQINDQWIVSQGSP